MAKELPFFKFEVSEWVFGRIQKQPLDVQGIFINLCCKYWHKLGELSHEDACLDFGHSHIDALEKAKIIGRDGEFIYIQFLDRQLDECQETSDKNRIAGLLSAAARAKRKSTPVERPLNSVERNPTEEKRREEKIKEEKRIHECAVEKIEPFDDLWVEQNLTMKANLYPGVDIPLELEKFKAKVAAAPKDYTQHDVSGMRKALLYHLSRAPKSQNGKEPKKVAFKL